MYYIILFPFDQLIDKRKPFTPTALILWQQELVLRLRTKKDTSSQGAVLLSRCYLNKSMKLLQENLKYHK